MILAQKSWNSGVTSHFALNFISRLIKEYWELLFVFFLYDELVCSLHIICKHTSAEGHLGYEKCLQGSVNGFWALLIGYFENQLSQKYWLGLFGGNQLFSFWGPLKIFLDPINFIWQYLTLRGVIFLKFFDLSYSFKAI